MSRVLHQGHQTTTKSFTRMGVSCPKAIEIENRIDTIRQCIKALGGSERLLKIPDMPDVILKLDRELKSRYPNTAKVVHIIESNAAVAGDNKPFVEAMDALRANNERLSDMLAIRLNSQFFKEHEREIMQCEQELEEIVSVNSKIICNCSAINDTVSTKIGTVGLLLIGKNPLGCN